MSNLTLYHRLRINWSKPLTSTRVSWTIFSGGCWHVDLWQQTAANPSRRTKELWQIEPCVEVTIRLGIQCFIRFYAFGGSSKSSIVFDNESVLKTRGHFGGTVFLSLQRQRRVVLLLSCSPYNIPWLFFIWVSSQDNRFSDQRGTRLAGWGHSWGKGWWGEHFQCRYCKLYNFGQSWNFNTIEHHHW